MADQPSKKKGGGIVKVIRDLIKQQPKSANDFASQSNSTQVSVSSAFGAQDSVPGNHAGRMKPTVSSEYIDTISV